MNKTELQAAFALASVYMLRMLGLFMVMPVLAVLAQDFPDATPWLIGMAIGGYGLTQACLQIPMGILSDRIGRKPVILLGLMLFALGSLLAALADTMWMLVLGRILQGTGAIAGAIMALAADVSREQQRPKVMAIIGVSIGFSFYLAIILGPVLAAELGLNGIFMLTALLAIAAMPLVFFAVPKPSSPAPKGDTLPQLKELKALVIEPNLMRLNISVLLLHLLIASFFVKIPSLLTHLQIPLAQHWQSYLPILLISILGLTFLMRGGKILAQSTLIHFCILLLALAFVGMSQGLQDYWLIFTFSCVFFTAFNYLEANFPAMVSSLAPAGQKGSAMGLFASFQFFGAFIGGLMAGYSDQWFTPQVSLLLPAGLCLIWLLIAPKSAGKTGIKRYTLAVNLAQHSSAHFQHILAELPGVLEVYINIEEGAAYLKVQGSAFQLQNAHKALATDSGVNHGQ